MLGRSWAGRAATALTLIGLLAGIAPTAIAYNGSAAAAYADAHWDECGDEPGWDDPAPSPYICYGNDCTNYVSRAMHTGGGYGFIEGSTQNPNDEWYWYNSSMNTASWGTAYRLYYFLIYYDKGAGSLGGGSLLKHFVGVKASQTYNTLNKGGLVFFDWTNNGSIDHVRMEVGYGIISSPGKRAQYNAWWYTGDWADQHEPPRYHDFWNGYYAMSQALRLTTHVYEVHIPSTSG